MGSYAAHGSNPQELDFLRAVSPSLRRAVDYGRRSSMGHNGRVLEISDVPAEWNVDLNGTWYPTSVQHTGTEDDPETGIEIEFQRPSSPVTFNIHRRLCKNPNDDDMKAFVYLASPSAAFTLGSYNINDFLYGRRFPLYRMAGGGYYDEHWGQHGTPNPNNRCGYISLFFREKNGELI